MWRELSSAVLMVMIALLTLSQVVGRLLGIVVPDAGELAGYAMAGATFLALAYTFRSGGHIRANILLTQMRGSRRALEIWCLAALTVVGALFAAFLIQLVMDSHSFGDVSTGMITIPLWIPQVSMALGAVVLEIAVVEEFVSVVRGREPRYERAEARTPYRVGRDRNSLLSSPILALALLLLLASGMWVAISLIGVAIIGMLLFADAPIDLVMPSTIWGAVSGWTLTALPLFVWMGGSCIARSLPTIFSGASLPGLRACLAACCM